MLRSFRSGLVFVLGLAAITAAAYSSYSDTVSRTIQAEHCGNVQVCNRVTGVEIAPAPSLADLFLRHSPSVPTR